MFILQFLKRFIGVFLGGIEMIVIFPKKKIKINSILLLSSLMYFCKKNILELPLEIMYVKN